MWALPSGLSQLSVHIWRQFCLYLYASLLQPRILSVVSVVLVERPNSISFPASPSMNISVGQQNVSKKPTYHRWGQEILTKESDLCESGAGRKRACELHSFLSQKGHVWSTTKENHSSSISSRVYHISAPSLTNQHERRPICHCRIDSLYDPKPCLFLCVRHDVWSHW